jgi:formamidopyrimidine-DNA glycosylase
MPELPDVEVFRRYLQRHATGQRIEDVSVGDRRILHGISPHRLSRKLARARIVGTRRHGKTLLAALDANRGFLVLHFGMDGRLRYESDGDGGGRYDRVRFDLEGGRRLVYESKRMLGDVNFTDDPDAWIQDHALGPDAWTLDEAGLRRALGGRRGGLKAVLMNQAILAGIGNVYADEILYQAKLHPEAKVDGLDDASLGRLHRALHKVLEKSVAAGADPEKMPRTWLLPNRHEGARCRRCGSAIGRIKTGGRSTYFCPGCQKKR